ncbi:hypothetical protein BESB_019210 [Besnoitia besnoiti]|uniref:Uncharacterized protein n=1 Tax=Besnoitia besnoiti TaxID=94643 RepID=A0A2A9M9C4_BESBE|nr:hypothetical protein BESB_019210 [Besnoitia besnoiti]PFH31980.1 hypothetical protein BESB_019210 [Besnoitia besnoiti]
MPVQPPVHYAIHSQRTVPKWRWNPYAEAPPAPMLKSDVVAEEDLSIPALVQLYQAEVTALTEAHEEIMRDKRHLEKLLEPYISSRSPEHATEPGEDILLYKEGFDIRLQQFNENCKKASKLEWILQRKLAQVAEKEEKSVVAHPCQVQATCRALKKIKDQERLIKLLQRELDECLHYNDLYAEQLRKMRSECSSLPVGAKPQPPFYSVRTLHQDYDTSSKYSSDWMRLIRVNPSENVLPRLVHEASPKGPFRPGYRPPRDTQPRKLVEPPPGILPEAGQRVTEDQSTATSQLFKALAGITAAANDIRKSAVSEAAREPRRRRSRESSGIPSQASPRDGRQRSRTENLTRREPSPRVSPRWPPAEAAVSQTEAAEADLFLQRSIRSEGLLRKMTSRTLASPRTAVRMGTRTLRSPSAEVSERPVISLSRAMSSAFLGG